MPIVNVEKFIVELNDCFPKIQISWKVLECSIWEKCASNSSLKKIVKLSIQLNLQNQITMSNNSVNVSSAAQQTWWILIAYNSDIISSINAPKDTNSDKKHTSTKEFLSFILYNRSLCTMRSVILNNEDNANARETELTLYCLLPHHINEVELFIISDTWIGLDQWYSVPIVDDCVLS